MTISSGTRGGAISNRGVSLYASTMTQQRPPAPPSAAPVAPTGSVDSAGSAGSAEPAKRGRKRSLESRAAILAAARTLIREIGYAELTIEGIAARAGVGKQTIYRWWRSRADVLLEALADEADLEISIADRGSYRADLEAFLTDTFRLAEAPNTRRILQTLMAEAQLDTEFGARFRVAFLERRRDALRALLRRAADRGDLPARPAPETVLDLVFGALWYRILGTGQPVDDALAADLLAVLAR
jgi:AcrR family transcriptional regulator